MIFDLVNDFADVLDAIPTEHPRRHILKLLDEAIRRDVHFINGHPTTFFQCMWNTCRWYDCPEPGSTSSARPAGSAARARSSPGLSLSELLSQWRYMQLHRPWIQSHLVPSVPLGFGLRLAIRPGWSGVIRARFVDAARLVAAEGNRDDPFSANGTQNAIWDVRSGKRRERFESPHTLVQLAVSSNGSCIAGVDTQDVVYLWDSQTAQLLGQWKLAKRARILAMAFHAETHDLVLLLRNGEILLFNTSAGTERDLARIPGIDWKTVVATAANTNVLAAISNGTAYIFDMTTGSLRHESTIWIDRMSGVESTIDVSPGGLVVAVGGEPFYQDGRDDLVSHVRTCDFRLGGPSHTFEIPGGTPTAISLSPNGRFLAWGTTRGAVGVADLTSGRHVHHERVHEIGVADICWSQESTQIATSAREIFIWDVESLLHSETWRHRRHRREMHSGPAFLSKDGQHAYASTLLSVPELHQFDTSTGVLTGRIRQHTPEMRSLVGTVVGPSGPSIVSLHHAKATISSRPGELVIHADNGAEIAWFPIGGRLHMATVLQSQCKWAFVSDCHLYVLSLLGIGSISPAPAPDISD